MDRRLELLSSFSIVSGTQIPEVRFNNAGTKMMISFDITSKAVPAHDPNDPEKDSHRDIIDQAGGSLYAAKGLSAIVTPYDKDASFVTLKFFLNSKIPGSGQGFKAKLKQEEY